VVEQLEDMHLAVAELEDLEHHFQEEQKYL
jgi:hypothetical protein